MNIETPILLTLHGLKVDKFDAHRLIISRGWAASLDGNRVVRFPGDTMVDLTTIGVNGTDRALVNNADAFVYIIENQTTGDAGFIVSPSRFYGPGSEEVLYPTGWSPVRKFNVGFKYGTAFGGIPDYHVAHWPMPRIRLTQAEDVVPYRVANAVATGGAWQSVDLSGVIPDNGRMALLNIRLTSDGVSAGSAYIRSHAGQSNGLLLGSVSPAAPLPLYSQYLEIRVDSLRKLDVKTIGGARVSIVVLGYDMTELA